MKIIQSFWSGNETNFANDAGWYSYKYNWLSWILSCHQLVNYHDEVELYTDQFGYKILIEELKLPYTKVHVLLDEINNYPKDLWAVSKVKTFEMQKEPFIHVDGDVYVWESLNEKFKNSGLITQNLELTTSYYRKHWEVIYPHLRFMPDELKKYSDGESNFACNMGIIGGNNIDFFQKYCKKSIEFVDNNIRVWPNIEGQYFNLFFEQVLFYQFANQSNQKIDFLFPETPKDNEYLGFADFDKIPNKTYLHLLGVYKKQRPVCKALEIYTMKHYPEQYTALMRLINKFNSNNEEIEILNKTTVHELIIDFEKKIKLKDFDSTKFLLKRDLFNEGLTISLDNYLLKNIDFMMVLLPGFVKRFDEINNEYLLEIQELNLESRIYRLDEIDEIILCELNQSIEYFKFISKIGEYFDEEEGVEAKNEFFFLINSRIRNYLILKIISIYKI
ncbi:MULTISPECIES: DUF6734 family protein [Flavobacterium]|uniref:DUF6734 family protein n=1 Tax=Flavobacterium TaxID=237 RepID=UPI002115688C|nr:MULTISPECIES: DUF6734 family protein [Flavobacterium]UUF15760.1 hypothetical protein NLJ00_06480 [Flavobacterium panici]